MKIACLLLLILTKNIIAHPHHHTLAIADYNYSSNQFELSLKFLTEDYKTIVKKQNIEEYINTHLQIIIGSQTLKAKLLGKQVEPENSWFYLTMDISCEKLKSTQSIDVHNTLLLSKNHNQFNTVKINIGEQHTVHNFSSNEIKYTFAMANNQLNCKKQ